MLRWILSMALIITGVIVAEIFPGTLTIATASWSATLPIWLTFAFTALACLLLKLLIWLGSHLTRLLTRRKLRAHDYVIFIEAIQAWLGGHYQTSRRLLAKIYKRHPVCMQLYRHVDGTLRPKIKYSPQQESTFSAEMPAVLQVLTTLWQGHDTAWDEIKHKISQNTDTSLLPYLEAQNLLARYSSQDYQPEELPNNWPQWLPQLPAPLALKVVRTLLTQDKTKLLSLQPVTTSDTANQMIELVQADHGKRSAEWRHKRLARFAIDHFDDACLILTHTPCEAALKPTWLIDYWQKHPQNRQATYSLALYYLRTEQWQAVINLYNNTTIVTTEDHLYLAMAKQKLGHIEQCAQHLHAILATQI